MGHGVRLASKVQKVTRNVEDNLGKVVAAKKLSVFVEKIEKRHRIEVELPILNGDFLTASGSIYLGRQKVRIWNLKSKAKTI